MSISKYPLFVFVLLLIFVGQILSFVSFSKPMYKVHFGIDINNVRTSSQLAALKEGRANNYKVPVEGYYADLSEGDDENDFGDDEDDFDDDDDESYTSIEINPNKNGQKNDNEWMFFDVAKVNVKGGDGGNGCMAMRREFRLEFGGPSGGNGGHGGDVYLICDSSINTLAALRRKVHHKGRDGKNGLGDSRHGKR